MDEIKNFICKHFESKFYAMIREPIQEAFSKYFGIAGKQITELALSDLDNAFVTGTGINKMEIVDLPDGELRLIYRLEFTIKAEYTSGVAILGADLGYVAQEKNIGEE